MLFDATMRLVCCHCGKTADAEARMRLSKRDGMSFVVGPEVNCKKVGFVLYDGDHDGHGDYYMLCDSCWDRYNAIADAHFNEEHRFLTKSAGDE